MANRVVLLYTIVITFLEYTINANLSTQDQSHDVIQEAVIDGVSVNFHEYANGNGDLDGEEPLIPPGVLHLEPVQLRFERGPLCSPRAASVFITNRSNSTVRLNAISANSPHFHSSFFEKKTLPPDGNTTFNVVFLGREKGLIESTLYVHTSKGTYKYPVSGVGIENEYRLEHLVGIRIPVNASYEPIIHLHNPRDTFIQVTEASTSDERLSLRLPGGDTGDASVWRVPPHATRPVLKLHTLPNTAHNTYYLRIRVEGKLLVVVVELTAEPAGRAYAHPAVLVVGRGGTLDQPTTVALYASNSGPYGWRVRGGGVRARTACARPALATQSRASADATTTASASLRVLDSPIPPFSNMVRVGELTVDWAAVYMTGECTGTVRLLTDTETALVYTYHAHALPGTLRMEHNALTFVLSDPGGFSERNLSVTNMFMRDVHITDIRLGEDVEKYFYVRFHTPVSLPSTESGAVVSLKPRSPSQSQSLDSFLTVITDLGEYVQPVLLYSETSEIMVTYLSELSWVPPRYDLDALDLGYVPVESVRVRVSLMPRAPRLACLPLGASHAALRPRALRCLPSGESCSCIDNQAEFEVVIDESTTGWIQIGSQRLNVHVNLVEGRFVARPVTIRDCQMGALCKAPLLVDNTLDIQISVNEIVIDGDEKNLYYRSEWKGPIPAHWFGSIGTLYYAQVTEPDEVDMTSDPANVEALERETLLANLRYDAFKRAPSKKHVVIQILTDMAVVSARCHVEVERVWPTLIAPVADMEPASSTVVKAANSGAITVSIFNPTRRTLAVSLVKCERCNAMLNKELRVPPPTTPLAPYQSTSFTLPTPRWFLLAPRSVHHISLNVHSRGYVSQYFYIRNNLTVIEEILVTAQGTLPNVRLGGQRAGSNTPLTLEVLPEQISDCAKIQVVARRPFTIRNHGHTLLKIHEITINGFSCSGYGFKVLECEPFLLEPNGSKKIDIIFVPDFTLSRVVRTLTLTTDRGYKLDFLLEAILPASSCAKCLAATPRPKWESAFYSLVTAISLASAVFVLAFAFLESDRILKAAAAVTRERSEAQPLDLRNISNKWDWPSEDERNAQAERDSPKPKKRLKAERVKIPRELLMEFEKEMCQERLITELLKSSHSVTIIHPPKPKEEVPVSTPNVPSEPVIETVSKSCETDKVVEATPVPTVLSVSETTQTNPDMLKTINYKPVKRTKPKHRDEESFTLEHTRIESPSEPTKIDNVTQTFITQKQKESSKKYVSLEPACDHEVPVKTKPVKITKKERILAKRKVILSKQESAKHANEKTSAKPVKDNTQSIQNNVSYSNIMKTPLKKEISDPMPKRYTSHGDNKRKQTIIPSSVHKQKTKSPFEYEDIQSKSLFSNLVPPISNTKVKQTSVFSNSDSVSSIKLPKPGVQIGTFAKNPPDFGVTTSEYKSGFPRTTNDSKLWDSKDNKKTSNESRKSLVLTDGTRSDVQKQTTSIGERSKSDSPRTTSFADRVLLTNRTQVVPEKPRVSVAASLIERQSVRQDLNQLTPGSQRSTFNDFATRNSFAEPKDSTWTSSSWYWNDNEPKTSAGWGTAQQSNAGAAWADSNQQSNSGAANWGESKSSSGSGWGEPSTWGESISTGWSGTWGATAANNGTRPPPGFLQPATRTYDPFKMHEIWSPNAIVRSDTAWDTNGDKRQNN